MTLDDDARPNRQEISKAVTGYVDEPGPSDLDDGLIDPSGRGPAI